MPRRVRAKSPTSSVCGFAKEHARGVIATPSWTEPNHPGLRSRPAKLKCKRVDLVGLVDSVRIVGDGKGLCEWGNGGIEPACA